jgi:hypothetical protein
VGGILEVYQDKKTSPNETSLYVHVPRTFALDSRLVQARTQTSLSILTTSKALLSMDDLLLVSLKFKRITLSRIPRVWMVKEMER